MLGAPIILRPEYVYVDGELRRGFDVAVDREGRILSVAPVAAASRPLGPFEIEVLPRRVLFPGMANAHSHAFQRLLRGRTEFRQGERQADDFWSWRDRMYTAAGTLTPDALEEVTAFAFLEMLRAGITTVGEFHYLHRDPQGRPYKNPTELSERIVRAADKVGIRLVLLRVAYARGGQDQPLAGAQVRFGLDSVSEFVAETAAMADRLRGHPTTTVGLAAHSVRALAPGQLEELAQLAAKRPWPVHMHLAEQVREVELCEAETGRRPVDLAAACGLLSERFCAVHAIHLAPAEIEQLGSAGASVCACPTTERDLGDGVVPAAELRRAGVNFALGTDSQVQIDLLEEARALEHHLRLRDGRRLIYPAADDDPGALARELFEAATVGGCRALGIAGGAIAVGATGDFFTVDLDDPSVAACPAELLPALVFGGQTRAISDVMVGGQFVVRAGKHAAQPALRERFCEIMDELSTGVRREPDRGPREI